MKKLALSFLYLILSCLAYAQLPMGVEKGIVYLENDLDQKAYSKVKDQNDRLCALIKVTLTNPLPNPLILEVGGLGVTRTEERPDGELWFFVPYQVKNLEFSCKGYTTIPKIPVNLKEGGVYSLTIRVDASTTTVVNVESTSGYLKIRLNPKDAFLSIGKSKSYEMGFVSVKDGLFAKTLNYGTWYYKVEQDLYRTYEGVVNFNEQTPIVEVNLKPNYAYLNINTDPQGAEVYIDNKYVGKSPLNLEQKYKSGTYSIRLIKEDYYSENHNLSFEGNGEIKSFSYKLRAQFGTVECICEDAQAEIWINDTYKGVGRWKGAIGSGVDHKIEARKAGHKPQSISFSVEDNESRQVSVGAPVPLYAQLSIETEPMECEVYIDGKKVGESPVQLKLLACEHSLKLVKEGYITKEDKVTLKHNQQLLYQHSFQADASLKKEAVVFAINVFYGEGYFADENGSLLFGTQYAKVCVFKEGYAPVVNGKCGFINTDGEMTVPCIYDAADYFSEGYARVQSNGKWGFINTKGEIVVPFIYDLAGSFYEGYAFVKSNGKWGFINTKGEKVVPFIYDDVYGFYEGYAFVKSKGKWGFINTKGEKVVPCIYDNADRFYEGYAKVKSKGKWGFINTKGEMAVPCIYDGGGSFSEGYAGIKSNGKWGFINTKGEIAVPCVYDWEADFSEGYAKVKFNGKWGFINTKGEMVVPCIYDEGGSFSEGYAGIKSNGKYGFINTKGEIVVPCIYDDVDSFSKGYARVKSNGKWGVINKQGEYIIQPICNESSNISW